MDMNEESRLYKTDIISEAQRYIVDLYLNHHAAAVIEGFRLQRLSMGVTEIRDPDDIDDPTTDIHEFICAALNVSAAGLVGNIFYELYRAEIIPDWSCNHIWNLEGNAITAMSADPGSPTDPLEDMPPITIRIKVLS